MGIILPKWTRQKSSKETLEALQTGIQSLSKNRTKSQQCERSLVATLIMVFILLYPVIILVGVVLWMWFPHLLSLELSTVYALICILLPLMFYGTKKLTNVYFTHRKTQYNIALQTLESEKKKVLDEVMEKEPYKVARELLEKYDPKHTSLNSTTKEQQQQFTTPHGNVRQRMVQQTPSTPHPALKYQTPAATPLPATPSSRPMAGSVVNQVPPTTNQMHTVSSPSVIPPGHALGPGPGPPAPLPILPRDRTILDKVMDYVLGDGPSNRYALICSTCHSHNGMALKDDFHYLTFRCAYCFQVNNARKTKPSLKEEHNNSPNITEGTINDRDIDHSNNNIQKKED